MNRRSFVTAVGGAAVSATAPALVAPHRIGMTDVVQLQTRFAGLIASDHRHGGQEAIETHAVALAREALELQQHGSASQRVRDSIYACAAGFMSSAMWAAIDGRRFQAAEDHHERAAKLALMSGDQTIQFRIWSHAGSLYRHMRRPADALATNDVTRNLGLTRRDPLFASLGHARQAAIHGLTGDANAVRRSIDRAQESLDRAQPDRPRPVWLTTHYDQAELDSLALAAYLALGRYEDAEAQAHRSLALLRPHMRRSQAITSARLARAQLGQGDVEPAVTTAMSIPRPLAAHPRVSGMLRGFGATLSTVAGDSEHTRTWHQFAQDTGRISA
ncbi:hypothetical protein [Kitasatospora sp. NBC_01539]|uniref:hypothetical protein n=1 Tax=Kitasatospora sp. NBC_01539 TaxID=2903577 RepID=UPI0038600F8C